REAEEAREEVQVLGDREVSVEAVLLGHVPDRLAQARPGAFAEDAHLSGAAVRVEQARDDAHRGRLAGAVGADEPGELPLSALEREPRERADRTESARDAPDGEDRGHGRPRRVPGMRTSTGIPARSFNSLLGIATFTA